VPLGPGDDAPTFAAQNQHGERVVCAYDRPTVVYFYPRDDTPRCTTEAEEFAAAFEDFRRAGVDIYGVSTDGVESHRTFAEATGVAFDLLADPDGNVAAAFGVLEGEVARRTTFVVVDGRVHGVYDGIRPAGHARDVLRDLVHTGLVTAE